MASVLLLQQHSFTNPLPQHKETTTATSEKSPRRIRKYTSTTFSGNEYNRAVRKKALIEKKKNSMGEKREKDRGPESEFRGMNQNNSLRSSRSSRLFSNSSEFNLRWYYSHVHGTYDKDDDHSYSLQFKSTTNNVSRVTTLVEFVDECKSFLLSDQILADNLISHEEIADFLFPYCASFGYCEIDDTNLDFHNLPVILQLNFIWALCPPDSDDNAACLVSTELSYMEGGLVGFEVTDNNREEVENDLDNFCYMMYPQSTAPSERPSITVEPSERPSIFPRTNIPDEQQTTTLPPSRQISNKQRITEPPKVFSSPDGIDTVDSNGSTDSNNLYMVAGYSIAGALMLFLGIYALNRVKSSRRKDTISLISDESYVLDLGAGSSDRSGLEKGVALMGLRGIKDKEEHERCDKADVLQFDPNSSSSKNTFSFFPISNSNSFISISDSSGDDDLSTDEEENLETQLDAAMYAGDWDAVADLTANISISGSDEEGGNSSIFQLSHEKNLSFEIDDENAIISSEDAKRAAKIDKLLAHEFFEGIKDESPSVDKDTLSIESGGWLDNPLLTSLPSHKIADNNRNLRTNTILKDREDHKDWLTEQVRTKTVSSDTSSFSNLSLVESYYRHDASVHNEDRISELACVCVNDRATIEILSPMRSRRSDSSSGSNDDKKPVLFIERTKTNANDGDKSRSWTDRILFRKKDSIEETSELALQDDSSGASSWSHSSDEENILLDPYGNGDVRQQKPMQSEIEAFGNGFGLAAAEAHFSSGSFSDDSWNKTSDKSKDSLRDELDRAIESGDWTAVERQTSQMLEITDDEALKTITDMPHLKPEPDGTDSQEGWSSGDDEKSGLSYGSSRVDDERIATLEKLIDTDDWQGIVTASRIHNQNDDSTMASSVLDNSSATSSNNQGLDKNISDLVAQEEIWNSITQRAERLY